MQLDVGTLLLRRFSVRKNPEGKKPGKVSWVHGTKKVFCEKRAAEWEAAQEMGVAATTRFYDGIVNLYIKKYGYDMKDEDDLTEDTEDPTDANARDADASSVTADEAARRTKVSSAIRGRIGAWYRTHYGGGVEKGDQNLFMDLMAGGVEMGSVKPAKMQEWQFYSKNHYDERVKTRFEHAWKTEVQRCADLELPEPHEVKVRGIVTRQAWEEEDEDFKKLVRAAQEKEYAQVVRAWEIARAEEPSQTKEELSAALHNAGRYLQPVADLIQKRFGMNVTIMMCGPVGVRGGAIDVRSVHAGVTKGLTGKKWYQYDAKGYREAEKSMIRFSERCFTTQECSDRAVASDERNGEELGSAGHQAGVSSTGDTPNPTTIPVIAASSTTIPPNDTTVSPANPSTTTTPNGATASTATPNPASASPTTPLGTDNVGPRPEDGPPQSGGQARGTQSPRASPGRDTPEPIPEAWKRVDMAKWPAELRNAHTAFAMGAKWGSEWSGLVNEYLDYEAACGYQDGGGRVGGDNRPEEIAAWVNRGRKWFSPPKIARLGQLGEEGSYADNWWNWWKSIQPVEREPIDDTGMLTWPMGKMTWGKLTKMFGRNGFMQVMAGLLWWGLEEFRSHDDEDTSGYPDQTPKGVFILPT
ncbi:hypothetical protein B0H16DRAFT_1715674 [Mycena metata]|uniref:Uncharacterized protein n=1 Tax=Mycena metata TaxID=1033252 RepID=A0AAD7NPB4_9AGAR|nr:hypothetical protein B0H16DRAFT_1715674 [Mycena metata]